MLRASVRYLRRLARRGLRWIGLHDRPRLYRPDLRECQLLDRLPTPHGNAWDAQRAGERLLELSPGARAALGARDLLEDRFFIGPSRLAQSWAKARHDMLAWVTCILQQAVADRDAGIPVYSQAGPPLGIDFPWGNLPRGPGGDTLHAKRPHRFAFAPRNGLASHSDEQATVALHDTLRGWIACAGSARDTMCYDSNLGVIQRVLALSWCWAFLAMRPPLPGATGLELELLVLRILNADAQYLEPRLGQSVPNNHLLADWFAGWFLQQLLPEFLEKPDVSYERRFRDELLRQTYRDGGSFEHSAHYHEFACEMGAAYLLLCQRKGLTPDPDLEDRVRMLLHFQSSITGVRCNVLAFGNAVEDTLFPLDPKEGWCAGSLREIERALFHPELAPAPEHEPSVARAFWLLGGNLAAPSAAPHAPPAAAAFPDAGFFVYEDDRLDARLVFRTGPDEHANVTAGHMHADLLSPYVAIKGQQMLVDAGTYTYCSSVANWPAGTPAWREYLAGPAAHNTLCIDGEDPLGPLRGNFRQHHTTARVRQRHASGRGLHWSEGTMLGAGAYSGHTRGCIHVHGEYWAIYDRAVQTQGDALPRWYGFQFAPGARVRTETGHSEITLSDSRISLGLLSSLANAPQLLQGGTEPLGGWVSPRYGELIAAPQLRYSTEQNTPLSAFILSPGDHFRRFRKIELEATCKNGVALRLHTATGEDRLLLNTDPEAGKITSADGVEFDGRLLWLRIEDGAVIRLRWLDGTYVTWAAGALAVELDTGPGDIALDGDVRDTSSQAFRTLRLR